MYLSHFDHELCEFKNGASLSLDCIHGDLRLVGGESESEGRVEVCYKGGWYSVCGTEDEEASVMCKQLGYMLYPCELYRESLLACATPTKLC